jgi:hypothetical protein
MLSRAVKSSFLLQASSSDKLNLLHFGAELREEKQRKRVALIATQGRLSIQ